MLEGVREGGIRMYVGMKRIGGRTSMWLTTSAVVYKCRVLICLSETRVINNIDIIEIMFKLPFNKRSVVSIAPIYT